MCHGDGSFVTIYFRSFMTRSSTNYRMALVAPTAGDSIREAHSYEYDNNGNEVSIQSKRRQFVTYTVGGKKNVITKIKLRTEL